MIIGANQMADFTTVIDKLKTLEDKVEKKLKIDLPSVAWIVIGVVVLDIVGNILTSFIPF